jgi:hypothetical protein
MVHGGLPRKAPEWPDGFYSIQGSKLDGFTLSRFNLSNIDTKIYLIEILIFLFAIGLNSGHADPF